MIRLRKIEPTDLPYLYQWENDAAAWADGSNHNPLSKQDLRTYIENTTGDIYRDGQLRLVVETVHEDGECVTAGAVDLFDFDPRNLRAAVGIYIAPDSRGRGIGEETMRQIEDYAFTFLRLRVLYAVVSLANKAGMRLFEQAGFSPLSPLKQWTLEADATMWIKCNKQQNSNP